MRLRFDYILRQIELKPLKSFFINFEATQPFDLKNYVQSQQTLSIERPIRPFHFKDILRHNFVYNFSSIFIAGR